jgi:hypothetical protein
MDMLIVLPLIALVTKGFSVLDKWIASKGYQRPYYAVHVIHNAMIVASTLPSVYNSFTDIYGVFGHPPAVFATIICFALHFYHIMDYWSTLRFDDWLHHGLMIGIALPLGCMVPTGSLLGMNLFFTTGLPGGISYALLFAERNGWITREQEKALNVPIHVWIRAPGCTANAALIAAAGLSYPYTYPGSAAAGFIIAALTYWNGQYFMQQVVEAAARPRLSSRAEGVPADESSRGRTDATTDAAHEQ